KQVEKGRLLQLYRKAPFQGVVEYGVPSFVVKIGDDNGVFIGELGGLVRPPIQSPGNEGNTNHRRSDQPLPSRTQAGLAAPSRNRIVRREGFQICSHF